ncbi:arylsulfatase K [Acrasis kona]|uniref:Arylsulfatase K n=1 Tax=Acrasis kona TaxID=1008807 RepID=A0AAW2Z8M2_9EUKA
MLRLLLAIILVLVTFGSPSLHKSNQRSIKSDTNIDPLWEKDDLHSIIGFNYTAYQHHESTDFTLSGGLSINDIQGNNTLLKEVVSKVLLLCNYLIDKAKSVEVQKWKPFQHLRFHYINLLQSRYMSKETKSHLEEQVSVPKYYIVIKSINDLTKILSTMIVDSSDEGIIASTYPEKINNESITLSFDSSVENLRTSYKSERCCMHPYSQEIGYRSRLIITEPIPLYTQHLKLLSISVVNKDLQEDIEDVVKKHAQPKFAHELLSIVRDQAQVNLEYSAVTLARIYSSDRVNVLHEGMLVYDWTNFTRLIPQSETPVLMKGCIESLVHGEVLFFESDRISFADQYLFVQVFNNKRFIVYNDLTTRKIVRKVITPENNPVESEKFWLGNLISQGIPAIRTGRRLKIGVDFNFDGSLGHLANGEVESVALGPTCSVQMNHDKFDGL